MAREDARPEVPHGAAPGPALRRPVALDVVGRPQRLRPDEAGEILEHARAPGGGPQRRPRCVARAADEREEDAEVALGRAVVERHARDAHVAEALPAEAGVAPEGARVDRLGLREAPRGQRPEDRPLGRRQPGAVVDLGGEDRRHGDDRPPGVDGQPVGDHAHPPAVLRDPAHGRPPHDAATEGARDALGDELGAPDEAALLRAARRREQARERPGVGAVAGPGGVGEDVEQRELARLRAPDRLDRGLEAGPRGRRRQARTHEVLERLAVPLARAPRAPRRGDRHVEAEDAQLGADGHGRRDVRVGRQAGVSGVERAPAARDLHVPAIVVGAVRADADRPREREDAVLGRADVLAAELGDPSRPDGRVERPPADAVARLEHDDVDARALQPSRGGEPGEPGADDDDVGRAGAMARERRVGVQREAGGTGRGARDDLAAGEGLGHGGAAYRRRHEPGVGERPSAGPFGRSQRSWPCSV